MRKWRITYLAGIILFCFCLPLFLWAQEKKEGEEIYTIKKGDTLWDISSKFLKDPFLWPKLWQRNPYITNPHWIYPGNPVRLSPLEEPKQVAAEPKKEPVKPVEKKVEVEVKPAEVTPPFDPAISYAGFLADVNYKGIGVIMECKDGKNLMTAGDIVYLAFQTTDPVLVGNKYSVITPSEDIIRDSVTAKPVARRYNVVANLQIIDVFANYYIAKIIQADNPVRLGDMLQPYLPEKMEGPKKK